MFESDDKTTELDDSMLGMLKAYRELDTKIREWQEMKDALAKNIKSAMGDAEVGMAFGRQMVRYTRYQTRRLSPAKVALVLSPAVLADCYDVSEARKFTVVAL